MPFEYVLNRLIKPSSQGLHCTQKKTTHKLSHSPDTAGESQWPLPVTS